MHQFRPMLSAANIFFLLITNSPNRVFSQFTDYYDSILLSGFVTQSNHLSNSHDFPIHLPFAGIGGDLPDNNDTVNKRVRLLLYPFSAEKAYSRYNYCGLFSFYVFLGENHSKPSQIVWLHLIEIVKAERSGNGKEGEIITYQGHARVSPTEGDLERNEERHIRRISYHV